MTSFLSLDAVRRHKVVNRAGDSLGHIDDFIFDPRNGEVKYLVLAAGGVLGIGDRLFAIPFGEAEIDYVRERLILNFTEDDVKNAPGFARGALPEFAPDFRKDIEGFYAARTRSGQ